jgi:biotin carboxyl carrier protein
MNNIPTRTRSEEREPPQEPDERALLFRPAALEQRQLQWLGEVVLTGSVRQLSTGILFFGIAVAVVLFLFCADYTRKEEVEGRVMIDNGAAEIFAPTVGTVVRLFVGEGDVVRVGQPLLAVSTERTSAAGNSRQQISAELHARRSSLEDDSRRVQNISDENITMLKAKSVELAEGVQHLDTYPLRRRSQRSFAPNPRQRRIRFRTLFTVARYTVNPEGQSAQGQSWAELAIEAVKLSGYTLHQFLPGPRYAPDLRFTINNRHSCFWACLARQPPKEPCHLTPLAASLFNTLAQQSARNRRECISKPSYRVRGG